VCDEGNLRVWSDQVEDRGTAISRFLGSEQPKSNILVVYDLVTLTGDGL
jgi:hypothetical protein